MHNECENVCLQCCLDYDAHVHKQLWQQMRTVHHVELPGL